MKKYLATGLTLALVLGVATTGQAKDVDVHNVQPGENAWTIVEKFDLDLNKLDSLNSHLENMNILPVGQELIVDIEESDKEEVPSAPEQEAEENHTPESDQAPENGVEEEAPAPAEEAEENHTPEWEQTPEAGAEQEPATEEEAAPAEEEEAEETADTQDLIEFQAEVIELTNQEREAQGLEPLETHVELSDVATVKSEDMRDNDYFSHDSPTYGSPFDLMDHYGVNYRTAAENIAAGQMSPEQVVEGWMNSDGHRQNIMNAEFTHIGVGYAEGGSQNHYWTQLFLAE
ncbi:CAP domain-containing protein [Salsuginibacillus kocurii]|uniref:CAP domain-containing protein n=1 Tax=Salsuginibacillus kocurii TaxID=427078 RepID=UPI00035C934D|nr:CAP domain-containing protein [Salsuginibacillus kocurii]